VNDVIVNHHRRRETLLALVLPRDIMAKAVVEKAPAPLIAGKAIQLPCAVATYIRFVKFRLCDNGSKMGDRVSSAVVWQKSRKTSITKQREHP